MESPAQPRIKVREMLLIYLEQSINEFETESENNYRFSQALPSNDPIKCYVIFEYVGK